MFQRFGAFISRTWVLWLLVWAGLLGGLWFAAPPWAEVAAEGTFTFLPEDVPSRQAERLLEQAFPQARSDSSVVLLLSRPEPVTQADREFIQQTLLPELQEISARSDGADGRNDADDQPDSQPLVVEIRTPLDQFVGSLLVSEDERAMLVVVELASEFLHDRSRQLVNEIEQAVERLRRTEAIPSGLTVQLAGSAVLGRDLIEAREESGQAIQTWTIWIVVGLLLLVFRAPLVVVVPLATLYCAVQVTLKILALLTEAGWVNVFDGLEVYTTVLVYGAGVDYSLFLIARYREELAGRSEIREAVGNAVGHVGIPVSASAGTEILGIAMLAFASFGKFHLAGISIPLGLFITFLAALTLAPALLRLFGRATFWPRRATRDTSPDREQGRLQGLWRRVGSKLERRPGTTWLVTVAAMAPFAAVAVWKYNELSYGLVDGLPESAASVQGVDSLQEHFPAGIAGPLTLVIREEDVDFGSDQGTELVRTLTERLRAREQELKVADVRSVADPLGTRVPVEQVVPGGVPEQLVQEVVRQRAVDYYVSGTEPYANQATRLEIILSVDPLSRQGIEQVRGLRETVEQLVPSELEQAELHFAGAAASLRDLKQVAERDRRNIQIRVTLAVLVVLCLVLRRIAIPVYLIATVLFSYLATLGVTWGVFWLMSGTGFAGLDWTVPVLLFTLLVAVGEDYNILLVTRVDEEQEKHGPVGGVSEALQRTGRIISGCGIIMAGTFASLAVGGKLSEMYQLGFALAFGMLLDTFVVRPLLVPAWLVLVNSGRFGGLGRYLGARRA